jgi:hypothetical protein
MMKWIGAVILAAAMVSGGVATTPMMAAEPTVGGVQKQHATATDASARRGYDSRHRYAASRPYYPYYYGRPYYYSPGPLFFLPVPPLWGYGWEWY